MANSSYAPLADEVNPPFSKSTPAAHVTRTGTITFKPPDEERDIGDMGDLPRFSRTEKGKGRAAGAGSWDVEQGLATVDAPTGSYPPSNTEEDDEKRIQANLARMAARDQAEKRGRQSRLFARPTSIRPDLAPVEPSSARASHDSSTSLNRPGATSPISPTHMTFPGIGPTATTNPHPVNPFDRPFERIHRSSSSLHADPNTAEPAFGYAGPGWRGGGGANGAAGPAVDAQEQSRLRRVLPDKWWKALCAWGPDLDGGHDEQEDGGQGGRTNPFE